MSTMEGRTGLGVVEIEATPSENLAEAAALDQLTLAINAKGAESQKLFGGNVWDWLDEKDLLPVDLYHHMPEALGPSAWTVLGLLRGNKIWKREVVAKTLDFLGMTAVEGWGKFPTLKPSITPRK